MNSFLTCSNHSLLAFSSARVALPIALSLAVARDRRKQMRHVVCVDTWLCEARVKQARHAVRVDTWLCEVSDEQDRSIDTIYNHKNYKNKVSLLFVSIRNKQDCPSDFIYNHTNCCRTSNFAASRRATQTIIPASHLLHQRWLLCFEQSNDLHGLASSINTNCNKQNLEESNSARVLVGCKV